MSRRRFDTPCTVEVGPADRVRVHEAPARLAFGERATLHTRATVTRATAVERFAVRLFGGWALTELYEVSFSPTQAVGGGLR